MKTIPELYRDNIEKIWLKILVFGPSPTNPTKEEHVIKLLAKRLQIRDELLRAGHQVDFAEDIVDPHSPAPVKNMFAQEYLLLPEYDLLLNLVYTHGTVVELTMVAMNREWGAKTHFFICRDYQDGLAFETCEHAKQMWNAEITLYIYPEDLDDCNLLTAAKTTVERFQQLKFFA